MRTLRHLRYALLLMAAFAYANGPSRLSAAPSGTMSCSECDENSPCDTECYGTYGEEPWTTTCGDHRNWGGTCAGVCEDNFCDPWEDPSNCCYDCNPGHCGPPPCEPDYDYDYVSGPWAEGPVVHLLYAENTAEYPDPPHWVWHWSCDWVQWERWVATETTECESAPDSVDLCVDQLITWNPDIAIESSAPWDAEDACEDFYWYYSRFGTPWYCGF